MDVHLTIDVPDAVATQPAADLAQRARTLLIIDEVRAGRLTRSKAARALGTTLDAFLLLASKHGIDAMEQDADDLRRELADVARLGY